MYIATIELSQGALSAADRDEIVQADVIVGLNNHDQREFTIFGTPSLESTVSIKALSAMRTVRIVFDPRGGGLESVIALVRQIKGRDDFDGTDE